MNWISTVLIKISVCPKYKLPRIQNRNHLPCSLDQGADGVDSQLRGLGIFGSGLQRHQLISFVDLVGLEPPEDDEDRSCRARSLVEGMGPAGLPI
jgi:hypothetical protein